MQQFKLTKEYLENIKLLLASQKTDLLIAALDELYPADIAEVIDELDTDEAKGLISILSTEEGAEVLRELDEDTRIQFLQSFSPKEIADNFIDNLDTDDAADILAELPEDKKNDIIHLLKDKEQASDIKELMAYDEDTAGGLMAKELIKVNINWNVLTCIREMKKQAEEVSHVYSVYVVDDEGKLKGILSLKKLLLVTTSTKVEEIYNDDVISVRAKMAAEEVGGIMKKYDLVVLPVLNDDGKLIGRITIDDVVDVIREEADKDYQLMSGISENIDSSDSLPLILRARLPWLLIALFGGIIGSQIISIYEPQIMVHPEMAFFMPLIAAMGGNVGVQSSALIVQGLANNTLQMSGIVWKLGKELLVGLLNGLACSGVLLGYNLIFNDSLALSFTVSIALLSVIIFAAIFGTFVPLVLEKYKIDPALATGPFITTSNDIIGLFIYFMIGRLMYGIF